ncbi:MAG TPA: type VI secretion system baseplate subunit TssK [Longimicrobiales bacterium]
MQKVLWSKGALLTPQHLQIHDRFLEELVGFDLHALTFAPWGYARLAIDLDALAGGALVLAEAVGILPDGTPFDVPGSDPAPAPKLLEPHWGPDAPWLDVHLALPEHRVGGRNVASERTSGTRYRAELVMRRDENTGLAEKPLQLAHRNLGVLAGSEALEGSVSMPLARVVRGPAGALQLDPGFVPPLVNIAASEPVMGMVRRLVELLSARSAALSGLRRQRNQGLADFGVSDVANFWLLYTVNTHLPLFRHIYETRRGHPAQLFAAMSALAGALTTFSTRVHPRMLPGYEHNQAGPALAQLDGTIRELLETVVPANHVALPLRQTEPSVYATAIDQDRYLAAPQMYLALSCGLRPDELARRAPGLVKVSSGDQLERLIRQALPGLSLKHVATPPSALPIKLDYQYFLLDRSGAQWDAIRRARNLAAYVPSDLPEPQLELVILLPEGV